MKAYTDINQSKKLAEILPIESADHHYVRKVRDSMGEPVDGEWSTPKYGNPNSSHANYMVMGFANYEIIPCWSLAALIEQLDGNITNDDGSDLLLEINKEDGQYYLYYYNRWNWKEYIETDYYDDLVDACYEMLIKLYEQKLL